MSPQDTKPPQEGGTVQDGGKAMESLGEALAGVNIGSANSKFGSSAIGAAPFALAPGAKRVENDGWGNFTPQDSDNNANSIDSSRNEGLELFLSQSPSQTLGEDVFKFSHTNLPALAENSTSSREEAFRMPIQSKALGGAPSSFNPNSTRRRTESPSTGTTTSSRSVSPYASSNDVSTSRNMQSYQSFTPQDSSTSHSGASASLSANSSPYGKDRNQIKPSNASPNGNGYNDSGVFYENRSAPTAPGYNPSVPAFNQNQIDPSALQQQQIPVMAPPAGAGQVLYMAMPSPDGRGQVLQAVQMMQVPGKPGYTYVVPPTAANMQGGATPQAITDQSGMMVLPVQQPNNGDFASTERANRMANNYAVDTNENYNDRSPRDDYSNNQFPTDPAIASLYASPQRPPLDALLGQIRRLSRDQVGCRLVQQALDEEGPMAATMILQEGLPFWGEAMVDPFGNYLFQKILEKVTAEERIMLVKNVSPRLVNASLNLHGTRSVQKVVELCAQDEQDGVTTGTEGTTAASLLTASLAPAAARLCIDSHGNHVIQRILLRLGAKHSHFVFDAVAASVGDVARHRHGCCVIQRCLDSPQSEARAHLVRRIVEKSLELMQDAYGNYVVQYVLDVCSDDDVHAVCESVVGKVNLLAIQKFSSNVMEKCLERCTDRVKEMFLLEMSDPDRIRELMMDPFGNYVVQRALSVATHTQAIRLVESMRPHLLATQTGGPNGQRNGGVRNTAGGRRIIAKICRRFPNFTLNPVGTQEELYSQNKGNHRYLNHHQQGGQSHLHQQQQQPNYQPKQAPMIATYAPVGSSMPHYTSDPRMAQMQAAPQQQQAHYGVGGNVGYFEQPHQQQQPHHYGQGGYPGM